MSAPNTNLDTQKRRHRGPLVGMALAGVFVVLLIVYWLYREAATADDPDGAASQIQDMSNPEGDADAGTAPSSQPTTAPESTSAPSTPGGAFDPASP